MSRKTFKSGNMHKSVKQKFDSYPDNIRIVMLRVRELIFSVAEEEHASEPEETLKWGEPSYQVKGGSAVRMDWKPRSPDYYSVYFNCKTTLVETFREIYGPIFEYEKNRALVFDVSGRLPQKELKHCISLAFRYHKIKHLPLLGV